MVKVEDMYDMEEYEMQQYLREAYENGWLAVSIAPAKTARDMSGGELTTHWRILFHRREGFEPCL
jgi:hypothetical protein